MIREVGITRVIYEQDKFPNYAFTIASKKIPEGLDWRYITSDNSCKLGFL
jgi:hypothetical protein